MTILQTKNLTKEFGGVRAVDHLSLSIQKGTITSIIGPNGAGKTTLTNLLSGMLPIDGGMLAIGGIQLKHLKPYAIAKHGITRTFQNVRLFEQMTVLDNMLVVLTQRNVFSSLFERHGVNHVKQAKKILEKVGLGEKQDQLAANLSYGQRKLLEIGRALAMNAEILLFDEPFAGLFPEMIKTVKSIMLGLKQKEKTVVLIEHNMDIIRELSDYIYVLDSGKLLAEGKPEEVLQRREVVDAYLGE